MRVKKERFESENQRLLEELNKYRRVKGVALTAEEALLGSGGAFGSSTSTSRAATPRMSSPRMSSPRMSSPRMSRSMSPRVDKVERVDRAASTSTLPYHAPRGPYLHELVATAQMGIGGSVHSPSQGQLID